MIDYVQSVVAADSYDKAEDRELSDSEWVELTQLIDRLFVSFMMDYLPGERALSRQVDPTFDDV